MYRFTHKCRSVDAKGWKASSSIVENYFVKNLARHDDSVIGATDIKDDTVDGDPKTCVV